MLSCVCSPLWAWLVRSQWLTPSRGAGQLFWKLRCAAVASGYESTPWGYESWGLPLQRVCLRVDLSLDVKCWWTLVVNCSLLVRFLSEHRVGVGRTTRSISANPSIRVMWNFKLDLGYSAIYVHLLLIHALASRPNLSILELLSIFKHVNYL